MTEGFVYRWTNKLNGKWYLGSHKGSPSDTYTGSGRLFLAAIKKYGISNFDREILYEGPNYRAVEDKALKALNAEKSRKSYNMKNHSSGGFQNKYFGQNNAGAVLTNDIVLKIYYLKGCQRCIAKEYGVSFRTISSIKTGRTWSKVTKHDEGNRSDARKGRTRICKYHV